jgi:hypothetical protein
MHTKGMNVSGQFWYLTTATSRVTDIRFPSHPTLFCGPHSPLSNAYPGTLPSISLELFLVGTWNSKKYLKLVQIGIWNSFQYIPGTLSSRYLELF